MDATPFNRASELALQIYGKVLEAVCAENLVRNAVHLDGEVLHVQDVVFDLKQYQRVFVCGSGKASYLMALTLRELLGERVSGGLVATKHGHGGPLQGIEVFEASHPVPDETSIEAGRRMLNFAARLREGDLVLFALSGGASALMEAPVPGVTLQDFQKVTDALLSRGLDIRQINSVRSALSAVKRGGLAEAFARAEVCVIALSDVRGNDLATIGSGPFFQGKHLDPTALARTYNLASWISPEVMQIFRSRIRSAPIRHRAIPHRVIGDNQLAIEAAITAASEVGVPIKPGGRLSLTLYGESRKRAQDIAEMAQNVLNPESPGSLVFGGETVVTIKGTGLGGRCQELACAAAPHLVGQINVALLAGSTDGTDGPTDVAAGLVDEGSEARAAAKGWMAARALESNDSFHYLEACGGLVRTGPTQSNVNDIAILVRARG